MDESSPVTQWIERARMGDQAAMEELWRHYFARLARLARSRMALMSRGVYDEEDAALSAMHSFFRGMREDRFPQLNDRQNLWRLLVVIASRKVSRRREQQGTLKRGGDGQPAASLDPAQIANLIDHEPTPDFVAEMMDDLQARLDLLPDQTLRRIALLTMDGLSQAEIAETMRCTVRTIRRRQEAIRAVWEDADPDLSNPASVRSG